jgi:ParB-like chromosome segregation protein Spo0J
MFDNYNRQPINSVQWVHVDTLDANDYNPNHVLQQEMNLLKLSMLSQGWIQPVLVSTVSDSDRYVIIDGFHRTTLVKADAKVAAMTDSYVPCVVMDMTVPERKMLTVRINRAKGTHSAMLMHEMVTSLINEHGMSIEDVMKGIGATRHEVNTLLVKDLFERFDVENATYSKAWRPK